MASRIQLLQLLAREMAFRAICGHQQGDKPNILLFCTRRSGSTWLLNTLAAHPGMRYVGRPLQSIQQSRWRNRMPDLARAAEDLSGHHFQHPVHFEGEAESQFRALAHDIINCRLHIHPTLNFRAPYFHRHSDRVVFQMTYGTPLIEWFDANFKVKTIVLFRHPIANALSVMREGWPPECEDFLRHRWFRQAQLNDAQRSLADGLMREGTELEKHVLDWCLKMLIPWRAIRSNKHPDWLVLSYEQIVLEPEAVVRELSTKLDLPDVDSMLEQVRRPSRTVTRDTAGRVNDPQFLLGRWRERVNVEEERQLMGLVQAFGINLYRFGSDTPDAQ
jgi:hypothetical protein